MEDSFTKIIQTAWLTAYPRIFSDIPLSAEIFQELEQSKKAQGDDEVPEEFKVPKLAPELEARYKLVNRLLAENNSHQIFEIASGLSPRGFIMSQNPSIEYVELDLAQMIDEKRKIMEALIAQSKLTPASNLRLLAGNALDPNDLTRATAHFKKDQPIAVINEGLLRYLSFPEKTIVAKNIYTLLKTYGGVWITPDITLRKLLETQNEITMPGKNKRIAELTSKNIDQNRFENEGQARAFFEKMGFSVERHGLNEVTSELFSPNRLNIASDEVESMIGPAVVFVMKVRPSA